MRFLKPEAECLAAARRIRLVAMDVDGTLTDGGITYGCGSSEEIKTFHVRDGAGIKMMMREGLIVGIITGRASAANRTRAKELGLHFAMESQLKKPDALRQLAAERGVALDECAFVGDDLIDGAVCRLCGLGVAVGDAVSELLDYADVQSEAPGGHGAVRQFAEWLLRAQGRWEHAKQHYGL